LVYPFLRNVAAGEISGAYYMALAGSSSVSLWVSNGSVPLTIDSFIGSDTGSYSADAQVSIGGGYAYGMAVDPSGTHLYVINNNGASNHYIEKYTLPISGAPTTWALPGTGGPGGLAVDSSYLYLSDTSGKIFKYSTAGVSITSWSGYYIPTGVAVDTVNNVLYVGDMGNHVIYKSNLDGTGLTSFATISASAVRGVAVDSSQNVFATDTTFQVVYKYNSAGTLLCTIGSGYLNFPTGLIVSPGGYLYVIEGISNQIREFAPY
jgi:DNA-binding beta-propeller fold protein YncE